VGQLKLVKEQRETRKNDEQDKNNMLNQFNSSKIIGKEVGPFCVSLLILCDIIVGLKFITIIPCAHGISWDLVLKSEKVLHKHNYLNTN
jgi:hypothetical protein